MFILISKIAVLVALALVKRNVGRSHYLIAPLPHYGVYGRETFLYAVLTEVYTSHKHLTGIVVYGRNHHQLCRRAYGSIAVEIFLYVHHLLPA